MRFPLLALSAMALTLLLAPAAPCASQPVTVLLQFDHPGSSISSQSMEREVRSLLGNSLTLNFKTRQEEGRSEVGRMVIFRMHGVCSMSGPATEDHSGVALGSTYVSNGSVLPFGQVECDRLRASVQRVYGTQNPEQYERQLGLAMGRVVAHELYHMLAGSKEHTGHGVTKPGLSPSELVAAEAAMHRDATAAMQSHAPPAQNLDTIGGR